jgi:putative Mn2+ efflux pump MntP
VLPLLLVAGSVGLDNFAAAIAIGLSGIDRTLRLRVALVFALFEAGMPVIGLLLGRGVAGTLGGGAHVVGGLLLIAVGAYAALRAMGHSDRQPIAPAGARLGGLIVLAIGLSIDNLIVGFALGARDAALALAVIVIAVVSVSLSVVGLELGDRLGHQAEHRSEMLGAGVLVCVGAAILGGVI